MGADQRQKQALGLTAPLKARIIAACPDDLRGLRDRALIATGYDTLCRRSELVALRIEDIDVAADGSGTILVRRAKSDQQGKGRLAYLSPETVSLLNCWRDKACLDGGPIFRLAMNDEVLDSAFGGSRLWHQDRVTKHTIHSANSPQSKINTGFDGKDMIGIGKLTFQNELFAN